MCGACEDEVFLTAPNPRSVLRALVRDAAGGPASRPRFRATEVVDAVQPSPAAAVAQRLSLSVSRASAAAARG